MIEKVEQVNFMDKRFKFVRRTTDKFIYKNEDKDLEQLNILEILFSEEEHKIKKIDMYTFCGTEPVETIHIFRGVDNITEVDYYQNDYEYLNIDRSMELYNVSIHLIYSELGNKSCLEHNQLEIIKKGHKKHKTLYQIPLEDNYYITNDKKVHYISANCISRLKKTTEFLVPSIKEIETELFNSSIETENNFEDVCDETIEKVSDSYPLEMYIYDRIYLLLGKKGDAIIYQNTEDEILELEVYFNDNKDKLKEVRLIEYSNSAVEGIKVKAKRKIIRFYPDKDNKIIVSICNRKKESAIINGHTVDKNMITAKAIINKDDITEKLDVKVQNQLGTFNLINSPNNRVDYIDKELNTYTVLANSLSQFKIFSAYTPAIIRRLERLLITENKQQVLIKKYDNC